MLLGVLRVLIYSLWVCGLSPGALISSHTLKTCTLCWLETENCPCVSEWGVNAAGGLAKVYSCRSPGEQRDRLQKLCFCSLCWWCSCSDRWLSVTRAKQTHCCGAADGTGQTSWADPGSVSVGGQGHLLTPSSGQEDVWSSQMPKYQSFRSILI